MAVVGKTAVCSEASTRGEDHPLICTRDCGPRTRGTGSIAAAAAAVQDFDCSCTCEKSTCDVVAEEPGTCSCCCSAYTHVELRVDWVEEAQEAEPELGTASLTIRRSLGGRSCYCAGMAEQGQAEAVAGELAAGSFAG